MWECIGGHIGEIMQGLVEMAMEEIVGAMQGEVKMLAAATEVMVEGEESKDKLYCRGFMETREVAMTCSGDKGNCGDVETWRRFVGTETFQKNEMKTRER
jgi:hypothetical protein